MASTNNLSRDDFIQMLISELENQKKSQGNNDNFFTGKPLTTSEIYQKLCYDFPLVNDHDLRYFINELIALRKGHMLNDLDFQSKFSLNDKFLSNLSYFVFHEEGTASDSSNPISKERKEIIAFFLKEIFLEFPSYLLLLSQKDLSIILNPNCSFFDDSESPNHSAVVNILPWSELLLLFKNCIFQGNSSLLTTAFKPVLDVPPPTSTSKSDQIVSFQPVVSIIKVLKESISFQKLVPKDKKKKIKTLLEYIQALEFFPSSSNSSVPKSDEESQNLVRNFLAIKEIYSHLIYTTLDLLGHYPHYFNIYFPLVADALLEKDFLRLLQQEQLPIGLFYGNFLLVAALKNVNNFMTTEEEYIALHPAQKAAPAAAADNKNNEVGNSTTTAVNNKEENRQSLSPQLLKSMKEIIRKFLTQDNNLEILIGFLESLLEQQQQQQQQQENSSEIDEAKLLEIYSNFIDIGELLIGGPRIVSNQTKIIHQQFISSRLLIQLLVIYRKILQIFVQSIKSTNSTLRISKELQNVYWKLSTRLTRLLTTAILRDEGILNFISEFPDLHQLWIEIFQFLQSEQQKQQQNNEKHINQIHSPSIWNISFGIAFSYVLYLRLPTNSYCYQFWNEFLKLSTNSLFINLESFEHIDILHLLENHEDEEEEKREEMKRLLQVQYQQQETKEDSEEVEEETNPINSVMETKEKEIIAEQVITKEIIATQDEELQTTTMTTTTTTTTTVIEKSTTSTTTTTTTSANHSITEAHLIDLHSKQFQRRQQHNQLKQSFLQLLESLQFLCFTMNQEEFSLIRLIKGKINPNIEMTFTFMNAFFKRLLTNLKKLRQLFQENNKIDTWLVDWIDKDMKLVKTVFSTLEGNTSNKTD